MSVPSHIRVFPITYEPRNDFAEKIHALFGRSLEVRSQFCVATQCGVRLGTHAVHRLTLTFTFAGDRNPLIRSDVSVGVTILLPVGSEPGSYEIQVLDSELKSRASATGQAEIRNYITTLQGIIDLNPLAPGAYQLALRRRGEDWELFPARIE